MSSDIIERLNELLEAEQAGVQLAAELAKVTAKGYTEGELKKFREDEASASAGLRGAILKYGGTPSEGTRDFAQKVLALPTEDERMKLLARGQAWVVKRIDALLEMELDSEIATFLAEMREEHLENIDACHRRLDELAAPPSLPYRNFEFARLREAHDQLYYGVWREPSATARDLQRAYHQLGRYLEMLSREVERSRLAAAKDCLAKAMEAYGCVDSEAYTKGAGEDLDGSLSYCHKALDALLRHYRVPPHDPHTFAFFYDVRNVPFHDIWGWKNE